MLGVRGPFGRAWDLPAAGGADLVIVAGGIGLAPLRPVVRHAVANRARYRRVAVLIGARTPEDLLYPDEYDAWRAAGRRRLRHRRPRRHRLAGHVGVVTALFDRLDHGPARGRATCADPRS